MYKIINLYFSEAIYRLKIIFIVLSFTFFFIVNFLEYYYNFFFSELQLNELEYFYYNNLKYNNKIISFINYEYDWFLDYNLYFNTRTNNNIIIKMYITIYIIIIIPIIIYELYLFIIPACYTKEKKIILNWILYNVINYCLLYYFMQNAIINNYFLYWNEESFIYLYNEWIEIFLNINDISNINKSILIINFIIIQLIYFLHYYTKKKLTTINDILKINRNFINIILIIITIYYILGLNFIIAIQIIVVWSIYIEFFIIYIYIYTYYKILY